MNVEMLLSRLDGVRNRSTGQWLARCPAHDDTSPSLSVKETGGGTILIHCFAGCGVADIVAAVGLELSDLFPEKLEPRKAKRPRWNPRDLLLVIRQEAMICAVAAQQIETLTAEDIERVWLAGERIVTAMGVADVH